MKTSHKSSLGYLMIFLSAIGFGSYGVWSKFIGEDFGIFYQGWVRSAIVLAILIPIALATKNFKPVTKADLKWVLVPVLFGVATQAPLYYAFINMDIGTATLVFYSMYVITSYVIGKMFLGEKITGVKLASLLLAFIGLFLVFGISLQYFTFLALFMAALNGVASGGEVATTKKTTHKFSSLQIGIYVWAGILVTHLPLSLIFGETQIIPQFNFIWFSMLAFALVGLAAFWLVIEGFKYVDASIGGLIGLFEIIAGIAFGVMLFGESVTGITLLGGFVILLSAMLPDLTTILSRKKN